MQKVLIFDCDGVLADTERYGHLPAFNQMWAEMGVPWAWSPEEYGQQLKIGGGKERMAALWRDPAFLTKVKPPTDEEARQELIAAWHKRKTAIYKEIVRSGKIPPRSGVRRLAEEALADGWMLAVASTSARESVETVLGHVMGDDLAQRFALVLAGDVVQVKKPAPDIYLLVCRELDVSPRECVAIEDSRNGLESAHAAGMEVIITVSEYTRDEDFSEAAIVLTCLGDPGGERCQVLANRSPATPGDYFTVADLNKVLVSQSQFPGVS